ncbi:MAG: ATP-binding protein [Sedimentisphaerales bacterium]|nr:ATP-binding protein [Sedimentisphaerales bacterium]
MSPPKTNTTLRPSVPPPTQSAAPAAVPVLGKVRAKFLPPKIALNCVEGWGKTSCGAYAPKPAILMARGETGYLTLLGTQSVPNIDNVVVESWQSLLALLGDLASKESLPYKTLVLDAVGGFERLCHEYVCFRDFNGDWGEKGFTSYQQGYEVAVSDWLRMLALLDQVNAKGVIILLLGHTQIRPFKNPMGPDFDRYIADIHHKTWAVTHKWVDAALFGTYLTVVDNVSKGRNPKGKGIGGTQRILYTERRDSFDAKNRYGMPNEIDIPNDPSQIWSTIWSHIYRKEGK